MDIDIELLRGQLEWLDAQDAWQAEGLANLISEMIAEHEGAESDSHVRDAAYMRATVKPHTV